MRIRIGYSLTHEFVQPTPMIVMLNVHYSRASDLLGPDTMITEPPTPFESYRDSYGNWCNRLLAPAGTFRIRADSMIDDRGLADEMAPEAQQWPVEDLPDDVLLFLLPSRYCESDRLNDTAWQLFGHTQPGWERVQAVSTWVHHHITFGYEWARPTKSAFDAYVERQGVCPRLRPPRGCAVSCAQHPVALLHGIPQRYRRAREGADGLLGVVRGVPRRTMDHGGPA